MWHSFLFVSSYLKNIGIYTPTGRVIVAEVLPILEPITMASGKHYYPFATPVAIIASKLIVIEQQLI